ncbi:MAG TPA: permease-like cell division protein FtsX [Candidatus Angelobacter sp.]|jgi:cell division transport system permease protein|nr:permease-like cell division protein FtsX [Candidatus Angelobacter sp.]
MRRLIASLNFAALSALQNFRRNLGVSLAAVFTMGLILLMAGGTALGWHTINSVLQTEQSRASNMRIYLDDGASLAQITDFQSRLQHDSRIQSVAFMNKDQAAKEASQQESTFADSLRVLGSNPLPASLNVTLRKMTDLQAIHDLAVSTPIVQQGNLATDYNPDVISKLNKFIWTITIIAAVVVIVLFVISLVIIMNTIRTAVYVRRREIEIMKLVGATDWFVRWPFLLEGIIGGVLAAIVAGVLVSAGYNVLVNSLHKNLLFFPLTFDGTFLAVILLAVAGAGILLGALGSYLGVRRFLAV